MKRSKSPEASARRPKLLVAIERRGGRIFRIAVGGHAGFAARGRDVVCAAVSAIVLSAAHGVVAHCKARAIVSDDPDGDYALEVPGGGNARAQAVLETALSGLRAVARSYPKHVAVRHKAASRSGS